MKGERHVRSDTQTVPRRRGGGWSGDRAGWVDGRRQGRLGRAAGSPGRRRSRPVVRQAGRCGLAAGTADRQRTPRRDGVRQPRHRTTAAQRGHRLGRRSVRLRQHPRRGQHRGDPATGLRGSVGAGAGPDQSDDAGQPGRTAGLPAGRKPSALLRQRHRSVPVQPDTRPHHRHGPHDLRAERRAVPARGVRRRTRPGDRGPADGRPGQRPHLQRHVRQPPTDHAVQSGRRHDRPRRHLRHDGGHHRAGPVPRPGPRRRDGGARSAARAAPCGSPAPPA